MNNAFHSYIERIRAIAVDHGVDWDIEVDHKGKAIGGSGWNLNKLAGIPDSPTYGLNHLGVDESFIPHVNAYRKERGLKPVIESALSLHWQDLIKSAVIDKVIIQKRALPGLRSGAIRPLRILATCWPETEPFYLTPREIRVAEEIIGKASKNSAYRMVAASKNIIDRNHLSRHHPLVTGAISRPHRMATKTNEVRKELDVRKGMNRLPTDQAFWEAMRIVYSETPMNFHDKIRFAAIKIIALTGLRVGEVARLPADWKRWKEYKMREGDDLRKFGGIQRSLQIRYFVEKTRQRDNVLVEAIQHVPPDFEDEVIAALDEALELTRPLRERLRRQVATGRLFPEYDEKAQISLVEAYTRMTGNPLTRRPEDIFPDGAAGWKRLVNQYRRSYCNESFEDIAEIQMESARVNPTVLSYFKQLKETHNIDPPIRYLPGKPRGRITSRYFVVEELENYLRQVWSYFSDVESFRLEKGRTVHEYEMLFLLPKRVRSRGDSLCDITRYVLVGRLGFNELVKFLGTTASTGSMKSIFAKYSSDALKGITMKSHSFRHLQNTELFRLGISDAIITKRFGRKSVAQSHEYDHRSLAEDLQGMDVPAKAADVLSGKALDVYKLIEAGKAAGVIVDEYRTIQKNEGDEAAFEFLLAEADGLHATPYGNCVNSFTGEPCPHSLNCFNGCVHLTRSPLKSHTDNLQAIKGKYEKVIAGIARHPGSAAVKKNMRVDAEKKLDGVNKTLATPVGETVFPGGEDLSKPINKTFRGPFNEEKSG